MHDTNVYSSPRIIKVKNILDKSGMSFVWNTSSEVSSSWLRTTLNQRLSDIYEQDWIAEVNTNS